MGTRIDLLVVFILADLGTARKYSVSLSQESTAVRQTAKRLAMISTKRPASTVLQTPQTGGPLAVKLDLWISAFVLLFTSQARAGGGSLTELSVQELEACQPAAGTPRWLCCVEIQVGPFYFW